MKTTVSAAQFLIHNKTAKFDPHQGGCRLDWLFYRTVGAQAGAALLMLSRIRYADIWRLTMSMSVLVTIFISLVIGMLLGIVLEGWWPQLQRRVDALNDYWIGAELCDGVNLILGVMLISSPWVYEFDTSVHSQNALATGIVVTSLSIASFVGFTAWEEWGNVMAGLWLVVSPWILNFNGSSKWYQVAIGIVIAALAKNELWFRSAASRNSGKESKESAVTLAPRTR